MLLLCVTVLTLSMGQPAKAVVTEAALASALLATLAAFGISLSAAGGIDSVGPWVVDKFENFVDSIGESIANVVDSMRYGVDKAGNLIGSPASLDYSARFALALQNEYSLSDNSSVSTSSYDFHLVNGYPMLFIPANTSRTFNCYSNGNLSKTLTLTPDHDSYFYQGNSTGNIFSVSPFYSGPVRCLILTSDGIYNTNLYSTLTGCYSYSSLVLIWSIADGIPFYEGSNINPTNLLGNNSLSVVTPSGDSVSINTGTIDIPQVGDYTDEDGIFIDGLGSWGDTLQDIWNKVDGLTFPDSVWPTVEWGSQLADQLVDSLVSAGELTTENSPGFFNGLPLISGIPDFSFGDLWHYVTDWVGYMSGGLSLIGGIMFSLPFVAAFYALVVILIVLSLWRLLRSA